MDINDYQYLDIIIKLLKIIALTELLKNILREIWDLNFINGH